MYPAGRHYRYRNDIYNRFISMNALCESNAKSLGELGLSPDGMFHHLMTTGVILQIKNRYYLNEEKAIRYFRRRSLIISATVILFLLLALIGYLVLV